ncbi:DNA polymerase III subunit delta [Glaciecola petra]|uniref:DNA polymerase III subunit delta n=1 Tax=Glaciecola petra TaxID=3075602 RepID=A0ABU2ZPG6_9ALTE|nr:DNA polymerase III subunit delta [Aestuariibacter sp. P117]MDT0594512.1 DNA polymerase III subunit delta [Aestuariibacter sp. P117]
MQINANDITRQLKQNALPPFILLFGDEPQQKLDIIDAIRQHARQTGFDERQTFTLDSDFEWAHLIDAMQSMSLFSDKQYIELTMPSSKPGATGAKQFQEIANIDNPDVVLLIQGPKAGKDVQKTKWFSALANKGWFCHVYDLEGAQLQKWLSNKAHKLNLNIETNAITALADMCEGNIMAGRQELEKLALLYPSADTIKVDDVAKVMVQQSRYSSFQFTDEVLKGDMRKAIRMLARLEEEGVEPVVILWSLVNEAQNLAKMRDMQNTQGQINFRALRVWPNKQNLYQSALNRLADNNINHLIEQLSYTDILFKSTTVAKPYVVLSHLALLFLPSELEAYALA